MLSLELELRHDGHVLYLCHPVAVSAMWLSSTHPMTHAAGELDFDFT